MFIPSNAYNSNEIDLNGFQIEADSVELNRRETEIEETADMYHIWVNLPTLDTPPLVAATPSTPAMVAPPIKKCYVKPAPPVRRFVGVSTVAAPILRR